MIGARLGVYHYTAEALCHAAHSLRGHFAARIPHGVFPGSEGTLISMLGKISRLQ
jgi:hypothetical protein